MGKDLQSEEDPRRRGSDRQSRPIQHNGRVGIRTRPEALHRIVQPTVGQRALARQHRCFLVDDHLRFEYRVYVVSRASLVIRQCNGGSTDHVDPRPGSLGPQDGRIERSAARRSDLGPCSDAPQGSLGPGDPATPQADRSLRESNCPESWHLAHEPEPLQEPRRVSGSCRCCETAAGNEVLSNARQQRIGASVSGGLRSRRDGVLERDVVARQLVQRMRARRERLHRQDSLACLIQGQDPSCSRDGLSTMRWEFCRQSPSGTT